MPTYKEVAENSRTLTPYFREISANIPYETKGVLYSEILFMLALLKDVSVSRIIESGRARGQSTLLLAKVFPHAQIISLEYNENSPDVPVANKRLQGLENVSLLFGDSCKVFPEMVQAGDVVIIDGPKMFKAVRLALKLLATRKPLYVFIHDIGITTRERTYFKFFMPEVMYSDNREVATITSKLDTQAESALPDSKRISGSFGEFGYGFCLAAIPYVPEKNYWSLYYISVVVDAYFRVVGKISRTLKIS